MNNQNNRSLTREKIIKRGELAAVVVYLRRMGKTIVTTNGVFDLLHVGHVRFFTHAKRLGNVLIVGVNSDRSTRENKGEKRPIVPEDERMEVVAALQSVDYVTLFDEKTPEALLSTIRPDVHVKGEEYRAHDIPERSIVESHGGRVVFTQDSRHATTKIIETICKRMTPHFL